MAVTAARSPCGSRSDLFYNERKQLFDVTTNTLENQRSSVNETRRSAHGDMTTTSDALACAYLQIPAREAGLRTPTSSPLSQRILTQMWLSVIVAEYTCNRLVEETGT